MPPRDILIFADKATKAAENELKQLIPMYPNDIMDDITRQVNSI